MGINNLVQRTGEWLAHKISPGGFPTVPENKSDLYLADNPGHGRSEGVILPPVSRIEVALGELPESVTRHISHFINQPERVWKEAGNFVVRYGLVDKNELFTDPYTGKHNAQTGVEIIINPDLSTDKGLRGCIVRPIINGVVHDLQQEGIQKEGTMISICWEGGLENRRTDRYDFLDQDNLLVHLRSLKTTDDLMALLHESEHTTQPLNLLRELEETDIKPVKRAFFSRSLEHNAWKKVWERLEQWGLDTKTNPIAMMGLVRRQYQEYRAGFSLVNLPGIDQNELMSRLLSTPYSDPERLSGDYDRFIEKIEQRPPRPFLGINEYAILSEGNPEAETSELGDCILVIIKSKVDSRAIACHVAGEGINDQYPGEQVIDDLIQILAPSEIEKVSVRLISTQSGSRMRLGQIMEGLRQKQITQVEHQILPKTLHIANNIIVGLDPEEVVDYQSNIEGEQSKRVELAFSAPKSERKREGYILIPARNVVGADGGIREFAST